MRAFHLLRVNGENYIVYRHPSDEDMHIYKEFATLGRSGDGLETDLNDVENYIDELEAEKG